MIVHSFQVNSGRSKELYPYYNVNWFQHVLFYGPKGQTNNWSYSWVYSIRALCDRMPSSLSIIYIIFVLFFCQFKHLNKRASSFIRFLLFMCWNSPGIKYQSNLKKKNDLIDLNAFHFISIHFYKVPLLPTCIYYS